MGVEFIKVSRDLRPSVEDVAGRLVAFFREKDTRALVARGVPLEASHLGVLRKPCDLMVLGPGGVMLLEVRTFMAARGGARGKALDEAIEWLSEEVELLRSLLEAHGLPREIVRGALVLPKLPKGVSAGEGIEVVEADAIQRLWEEYPQDLAAEDLRRLRRILLPGLGAHTVPPALFDQYKAVRRISGSPKRGMLLLRARHLFRHQQVLLCLAFSEAGRSAVERLRSAHDVLARLQLKPWAPRLLDRWRPLPGSQGEIWMFSVAYPVAPSLGCIWGWLSPREKALVAAKCLEAWKDLSMALQETLEEGPRWLKAWVLNRRTIRVGPDQQVVFAGFDPVRASLLQDSGGMEAEGAEITVHGLMELFELAQIHCRPKSAPDEHDLTNLFQELSSFDLSLEEVLDQLREWVDSREKSSSRVNAVAEWSECRMGDWECRIESLVARSRGWAEFGVCYGRARDSHEWIPEGVGRLRLLLPTGRPPSLPGDTSLEGFSPIALAGGTELLAVSAGEGKRLQSILLRTPKGMRFEDAACLVGAVSHFVGSGGQHDRLILSWARTLCESLLVDQGRDLGGVRLLFRPEEACLGPEGPFCVPGVGREPPREQEVLKSIVSLLVRVAAGVAKDGWDPDREVLERLETDFPGLVALYRAVHREGTLCDLRSAIPWLSDRLRSEPAEAGLVPAVRLPRREAVLREEEDRLPQEVGWLDELLQSYPGGIHGNRETRGLDSEFARATYVPTPLERELADGVRRRSFRLAVLCGNAGDGKTALLQHLAETLGGKTASSSERVFRFAVDGGPQVAVNLDGSASYRGRSSEELLDEFLGPFLDGPPREDIVHLLAINDGRLLEWIESSEERHGPRLLTNVLRSRLGGEDGGDGSFVRFVDLNQRSLVGEVDRDSGRLSAEFLGGLIDSLYGGERAAEVWRPCHRCSFADRCMVVQAGRVFGPGVFPGSRSERERRRARQRLIDLFQAVHMLGRIHVTMRELRAALVYVLFGIHGCRDYQGGRLTDAEPYWQRAFSAASQCRQGEVLAEFVRLDPALVGHPKLDRFLRGEVGEAPGGENGYGSLPLREARRRAYFELDEETARRYAGEEGAVDLFGGRYLRLFRDLAVMSEEERLEVLEGLCRGISLLEHLPIRSLRQGRVALRVSPHTPTETVFWVEKGIDRFSLRVPSGRGLHRAVELVFCSRGEGQTDEVLPMGAELFGRLMEVSAGYRLGDVSSDESFSNLRLFVDRLMREDERMLFAWNPLDPDRLHEISVQRDGATGLQVIRLSERPLGME